MSTYRVEQVKEFLKKNGCDIAIFNRVENVVLLSGGYWPRNGLSFAVIPAEGKPALVVPSPEKEDVTPGYKHFQIMDYGTVLIRGGDSTENLKQVFQSLKTLWNLPSQAIIAYEKYVAVSAPSLCDGEVTLTGRNTHALIEEAFDGKEVVDIEPYIEEIRTCKTPDEIEKIRMANRMGYVGIAKFKELLDSGQPLTEIGLGAAVESEIAVKAHEYGVRYARAWAQITSGLRTVDAWKAGLVTTDKPIEDGDLVMLEMCTAADGYFSDLTCTWKRGQIDAKKQEMLDLIDRSQEAARMQCGKGKRAVDAFQAAYDICKEAGYEEYFLHGIGHGTGWSYHDGRPGIGPGSEDIFEVGMIHSVEPGIYVPGVGGVRQEVNVVETEDGCEILK